MFYFIILSILISVTPIVSEQNCQELSKVDAITSFSNGTVFIAYGQYYWLLDNKTMNQINSQKPFLIRDLLPGMNSLKMAVSIRYSLDGEPTEILFFHTFEENQYKSRVYMNDKWKDGKQFVQQFFYMTSNQNLSNDTLDKTKILMLYFRDEGNPSIYLRLNDSGTVYTISKTSEIRLKKWEKSPDFIQTLFKTTANQPSIDSIYVKTPDDYDLTYLVFTGNQYYLCRIKRENKMVETKEECDSGKQEVGNLIKCLTAIPPDGGPQIPGIPLNNPQMPNQTITTTKGGDTTSKDAMGSDSKKGFKKLFIWIVVAILVVSSIILIIVIIVYCNCLKAVIAFDTETEKQKPLEKEGPLKPLKSSKKSVILSETEAIDTTKEQNKVIPKQKDKSVRKYEMNARVKQMEDILGNDKKKIKSTKDKANDDVIDDIMEEVDASQAKDPKSPKITFKPKQKNPKVEQIKAKEMSKSTKRTFADKDKGKYEQNVKDFGKIVSETPKKTPEKSTKPKPIDQQKTQLKAKPKDEMKISTKVHSKAKPKEKPKEKTKEKPKSESKVSKSTAKPTDEKSEKTSDDRLRQLMSSPDNTDDRVNQLLSNTSTISPPSKIQNSRAEKLLKE